MGRNVSLYTGNKQTYIHSILILLQINKSTIYKKIYDNVQMHEYIYKALPLTSTLLNFTVGGIIKNINQPI